MRSAKRINFLSFLVAISASVLLTLPAHAETIDGYQLPPMFEDNHSQPIPVQGQSDSIVQEKAEPAFRPIQIEQAADSRQQTKSAIPVPIKRPNEQVLEQQLVEMSINTVEYASSIIRPIARPEHISFYDTVIKKQKAKDLELGMPAVPPVSVQASSLPQPEFIVEDVSEDAVASTSLTADGVKNISTPLPLAAEPVSLLFELGITEITKNTEAVLKTDVVDRLLFSPDMRIEIKSYAEAVDESASSSRRVSLARALSVRSFLLNNNIETHRMDVRALGDNTSKVPVDRVEIVFIP